MAWPSGAAAFVTGAASGIGLGIARALVKAGAKVALADIDESRLTDIVKELTDAGGTVVAIQLDVSNEEQWTAAADKAEAALGPISILVNNAGVSAGGPLDKLTFQLWRWVMSINADAQFLGVSTFLPRFEARGGKAYIMNTSSMAGLVPMRDVAPYVASKFASLGMTMVLRDELAGTDIGVSVLCPGSVATRLGKTAEEAKAKLLGQEPDARVIEQNTAAISSGADPDKVGEQVVEAMQNGQFLIITHREWLPLVKRVNEEEERAFTEFDGRHGVDTTAQFLASGGNPVAS